ncbi:MAG: alpha-amylase [Anaerolinea sp.]|nr:alpha-amylase [Anaerolinea sp.]
MQGAEWWREAVAYQIYPRSFQDSNGDGIGDIPGIIARLDYLNDGTERSLGIDAIWLSPTFPSPMKDFGYDVSDYLDVHPDFGTLADMDRLIAECHGRGIRLLLDYVPNHTSDMHPWFIESRSSRTAPKRDWYVWRDAKPDGSPPNNWLAVFGGPAWEFDTATGQYYLHSFLKEQPDLNWRNPGVVAAMHDVLRFWLARGIDGFRIDVMGMVLKHPDYPDNPPNPNWRSGDEDRFRQLTTNNVNHPDVFDAVRGIRAVLDEFGGMAVGEVFGNGEQLRRFYGSDALDGLQLAFDFRLIREHEGPYAPWDADYLRRVVEDSSRNLPAGAQPCYALDNHDRFRLASRLNHDGLGQQRARAAVLLLLGLRGTPFLYYGAEIGMVDVDIPEDRLQDPARFHYQGRDPERTPMQWDASAGRGFTTGEPWLPYGPIEINVEAQRSDPDSMLSLHRRAIWRRKELSVLRWGSYRLLDSPAPVFAFERATAGERPVVVAVNTSTAPMTLELPGSGTVLVATHMEMEGRRTGGSIELPPLAAAWVQVETLPSGILRQ